MTLDDATLEEFETLLLALDTAAITRAQWDRLKVIICVATLEAGDSESGAEGYRRSLAKWRGSFHYDGDE
jgi:hypothetical protein